MGKKFFSGFLLSLLVFGACGKKEVSKLDTLVLVQGSESKSLDPHSTTDLPSSRVVKQINDRLFELNESMEIVPSLAEKWEFQDPKTLIIELKKNVKFHNGEVLKASDVKFSLERMKNSPASSPLISMMDSVEIVDENKVKINLSESFAPILSHLTHTAASILSEKAVNELGKTYGQNPVGTGAYKFSSWAPGEKIELVANEVYWDKKANIKNVVIKTIPESSSRTIALETGEAQIAYDIDAVDHDNIRKNEKLNLIQSPGTSISYLGFNFQNEVLSNKDVRTAIAKAINLDDIVSTVTMGAAKAANSPIAPLVFGYNENSPRTEVNMEEAKSLVEKSGFKGQELKLSLPATNARIQIAQIVQANLKDIGLNIDIEILEWGAYLEKTIRGDHELFLLGFGASTGDADYALYPLFHSKNQGAPGNRSFYSNGKIDNLLDEARRELKVEKRKELYTEVQNILQDELPILTLYYDFQTIGTSKNIEGIKVHPSGASDFKNISYKL